MPTITDAFSMPITITQHGLAEIVAGSVVYPASVEPSTPFTISYQVKNSGVTDTLWGHLIVGTTEISGSAWSQSVAANTIITKTFTHPGITAATTIILQVGRP